MAVTEALRQSIILGAANITGPIGDDESDWEIRLKQNAKRLTSMLSPESVLSRAIDTLDGCDKFTATIAFVGQEEKSKRGYVVLKGAPTDKNETGLEALRTEIVAGSKENTAFAKRLRSLTGHRVLVFKELQEMKGNGRKVRVIQHVEDLGEDHFITDEDLDAAQAFANEQTQLKKPRVASAA